ncbi:anaerobic ribonucleoside-triphosphate reductase activating protein [Capnocytophaga sp. oral taxon 878]|uniref:anaerobic ribonucleoside-triphosphate reductase activating protein n=1 Tax=Capnocytophaga sp. oral taxon 878 TaxID=1316596 RepID=UPI000D02E6A8|nr:anaerobic ribonucleoside-triphosphate reductase activating protein [Capnocytophaga sp. oral taxon 878]AVM50891.1 anaerobic ribonucleoside-triphosphate reductase activating protein [Capnocytophaga sp. oral taxon 878]
MQMLRYSSYNIVLQEVPNEISLCFTITGCKLACEGCHSEYTWDGSKGEVLTNELLQSLLTKYNGMISCVLFMGGEWEADRLLSLIFQVKCKQLKTALYTGLNLKQVQRQCPELLACLDYIKTGKWLPKLGGLNSPTTNQEFLNLQTGEVMNYLFRK